MTGGGSIEVMALIGWGTSDGGADFLCWGLNPPIKQEGTMADSWETPCPLEACNDACRNGDNEGGNVGLLVTGARPRNDQR